AIARFSRRLGSNYVEISAICCYPLRLVHAHAEWYWLDRARLSTRFVDLHPQNLFGSVVINKEDTVGSWNSNHPRGLERSTIESRRASRGRDLEFGFAVGTCFVYLFL